MKITVTLSANAGVSVDIGRHRILVDALHDDKRPGFSAVGPEIWTHPAFQAPGHICFTHCHGDHFSPAMTRHAAELWPHAQIYLPEPFFPGQHLVSDTHTVFSQDGLTLRFLPLPHEGSQYADVKHYGLLISLDGHHILIAGDCAAGSPALTQAVKELAIDIAVLDFPWLTLAKGRAALEMWKPKHILGCHLPFAGDDSNGFRISAQRCRIQLPGDVRLLLEPFQQEVLLI